ncbi:phosphoribosylanthranilate isomerase [Curtobacterium sp. Csp1]|uniref:phosphoribosylanthranilate isomerase n=1 Tax=unclassified Curtobacterium TaxID=257496 RepID=UPI001597762C|nr:MULTISPECIES: phosphoribosylanthranilate isomerase [unclassified Curtobacterium]QKS12497.1 phosphoribosylanthranilate isomerase [Curtobacterium sp. csp3]QKS20094.1 phosphoribosylanthranilate isomerase [Curtobacterium sp. Csp1]QKS21818.1 phosphoribosylanthranilate isomerase [Curtobacterium sp. Csp1]
MSDQRWIKICGLSTPETVDAAVDAGADAVGFVFAAGSPRTVTADLVKELVERVPEGIDAVGVFRDQQIDEIVGIASEVGLTTLQLHGGESASDFARARDAGFFTIRAVAADDFLRETPEQRAAFDHDLLLLDAAVPGSGRLVDPATIAGKVDEAWILAGGLTPANVAAAVQALDPDGVDVSSGVESERGVKDVARIRSFVEAVRSIP